ncbi:hypothetical protein PHYPSEUDO_011713 [Phytophthora pseudosyringae]|uniref:Uncharacterized protein n=1 Tax=Phytophthora pseudosyringae TaxID=221518 RepID=A0A8T1WB18_9STRA|nr:hypothetical protein PHYPSEUDO_011713 [Phytophthora pseudosyringae]
MQEKLAHLGSDLATKQAELQKLRNALQVDTERVRLWEMQGDGLGASELVLSTEVALLEIFSGTNDKDRVHEAQPNEVMQQQEIECGAITATPSKRKRPANLLRRDETPKHRRPANPSWNCCKVPTRAQDGTSLRM